MLELDRFSKTEDDNHDGLDSSGNVDGGKINDSGGGGGQRPHWQLRWKLGWCKTKVILH